MNDFSQLITQYESMIYSCMRKLHIYKDHDEFYQAALIALWKCTASFSEGKGDFSSYAYRSMYGAMLDELKRHTKFAADQPVEGETLTFLVGAKTDRLGNEETDAFLELTERLPNSDRQLLFLLYYDNHSLDEVADILHLSKEGVKKKRYRALQKLKSHIPSK